MKLPVDGRKTSYRLDAPELLIQVCLILIGILVVLKVVPSLVMVVMLCLAVYAVRGPKESIQALTIMFLVLNLNPGIFHLWGRGASLRWLVLFCAMGRLVWDGVINGAGWPYKILKPLVCYCLVITILSLLASWLPVVSVFKVVAFFVGATVVLTCFYRTVHLQGYWLSWFTTFSVFVLAISLPLYASALGYHSNGRGFQGILVHPQMYGPFAAAMTAGLCVLCLKGTTRSLFVITGLLLGISAIYTSQARTALLMLGGALLIVMATGLLRGELKRRFHKRPVMPLNFKILVGLALLLVLVARGDDIQERATNYLLKRTDGIESSSFDVRVSMVDMQLSNFKSQPLTGIGFGLPSGKDVWVSSKTGFMGLPMSFAVEKGFLPSAVLEETGLIGAVLLAIFLLLLVMPLIRGTSPTMLAILLACLLANSGEMVFFSFGGSGLYYWLLTGLAYASTTRFISQKHVTASV